MNRKKQLQSVVSSKSVDVLPNGSTKHTQKTSHLSVGTNSPPPESDLPQPPWFTNTVSKNVTSDSQVTLTLFSCPFPHSTELNVSFLLFSGRIKKCLFQPKATVHGAVKGKEENMDERQNTSERDKRLY